MNSRKPQVNRAVLGEYPTPRQANIPDHVVQPAQPVHEVGAPDAIPSLPQMPKAKAMALARLRQMEIQDLNRPHNPEFLRDLVLNLPRLPPKQVYQGESNEELWTQLRKERLARREKDKLALAIMRKRV